MRHSGEPAGVEVAPESADDVHERGASRNPDTEQEGAPCADEYAPELNQAESYSANTNSNTNTGRSSMGRI